MTRRRVLTVRVGWLALAGFVLAVLALTAGPALYWWRTPAAPACPTSSHDPAPALENARWPVVLRVVQPGGRATRRPRPVSVGYLIAGVLLLTAAAILWWPDRRNR